MGASHILLLTLAAFGAGWIDAVVGGGGLVQLPALLVTPGLTPLQALATNKLASAAGTTTSAITYFRRIKPDLRTAAPLAVAAGLSSAVGAWCAHLVPADVFRPIILLALVGVLIYTIAKPNLGQVEVLRYAGRRHYTAAALVGAAIGFYDGILGPGTGSFLVFALVGLMGYAFLQASAKAKIANMATNLGALLIFIPGGHVVWQLALPMAAANVAGGYLGARSAVSGGSKFIRIVFLVVVSALLLKLGHDVLAGP